MDTKENTYKSIYNFKVYLLNLKTYFETKYSLEKEDTRVALFSKCINVTTGVQFSLQFLYEALSNENWWDVKHGSATGTDRKIIRYEYEKLQKNSFVQFNFQGIESSLRVILKTIDPGACKDGTAEFESIYKRLLKITDLQERENIFKLARLIRNTCHNNSFYFHSAKISEKVEYRGRMYVFEVGKPVNFANWTMLMQLYTDVFNVIKDIMESDKVSKYNSIVDPAVDIIYEPR